MRDRSKLVPIKIVDKRGVTKTVYINPEKKLIHEKRKAQLKEIKELASQQQFRVVNDKPNRLTLRKELPADAGGKRIIEIDVHGKDRWRIEGQSWRIKDGIIHDRLEFYSDRVKTKDEALEAVRALLRMPYK